MAVPQATKPLDTLTAWPVSPASAARLLAFDTATETLALAAHGPLGAFTLLTEGGARASASLLPLARQLLAHAGLRLQDVQAVAFGNGPGAFTGLRTACAVAQGLGLGLGVPLLPINSLLVVAEDARLQWGATGAQGLEPDGDADMAVSMDARMDETYAARFAWRGQRWRTVQGGALYTLPALNQAWASLPLQHLAGSALSAFGDRLALPQAGSRWPREHNRAGALLGLALSALADGQGVDAAQAMPVYLRDKVAQTTAERQAVKAAAADALASEP